jgi:protein-arginine kinase activator protein McsA
MFKISVCDQCNSNDIKIGITNIVSGATVYPLYCGQCNKVFTQYIKKNIAQEYAKTNGQLKYVETATHKYLNKKDILIKCEVCNKNEGEKHHWSPRHLFGDEAERWPTSMLCRSCHKRWHDIVTPNMSKQG